MSNRKQTEDYILEYVTKIAPGGENTIIYQGLFKSMSEEDFKIFMEKIETGENTLALISPNFGKTGITVANNLEVAKELKHPFFERILIESDDDDTPTYLTPIPYLVIDVPLRRQAQLLVKKISIPEDNKVVDNLTGQPTGRSKGSRISLPELQVMASMGLDKTLEEFIKYRGGDTKGFNAMNTSIQNNGAVVMDSIKHLAGGVESTKTLRTYLLGMMLENTLPQ
jgi:hypothetical protein